MDFDKAMDAYHKDEALRRYVERKTAVVRFDSSADAFAATFRGWGKHKGIWAMSVNSPASWAGFKSRSTDRRFYEETAHEMRFNGDPQLRGMVLEAQAAWTGRGESIDAASWTYDVAGGFPLIPAFVSGDPECMRRRVVSPLATSPIKLVCWNTSSCGIEASAIERRGADLIALSLELSRFRPVELFVLVGNGATHGGQSDHGVFALFQIDVTQVDPATAAAALGPRMMRGYLTDALAAEVQRTHGWESNGRWPWGIYPTGDAYPKVECAVREALGLQPHDVLVPPLFSDRQAAEQFESVWKNIQAGLQQPC